MCISLWAIPAKRGVVNFTQPDGSVIEIILHGDEWVHWATDTHGNLLVMDQNGFYRISDETPAQFRVKARAKAAARRRPVRKASYSMTTGERHIPVVLAAFKDKGFTISDPNTMFDNLLNQHGYSYNGGTGSVKDFYVDNSNGTFTPIFDVYGPVTLDSNMSAYGADSGSPGSDVAPELAVFEACKKLDLDIDFSDYDYDNDGQVDMILFYYAGYNQAEGGSTSTIWPHQWEMLGSEIEDIVNGNDFDGKQLNKYFCTSELKGYQGSTMCGIGTTCHEFGHSMGLPDFYDTDYGDAGTEIGDYHGMGADPYSYSTMCSGSYNNNGRTPPYFNLEERILLGWADESDILELPKGPVTIPAVNNEVAVAYKTPTSTDGEYFLYECRSNEGWDAYLPGGPGLIVYHIDKSTAHKVSVWVYEWNGYQYVEKEKNISAHDLWYNWEQTNQINENAEHPCYYIVPAQDQDRIQQECDYEGYALAYDETRIPFPGGENVTSFAAVDWEGVTSEITLSNISYAGGKVTATVSYPSVSGVDFPFIDNPGNGVYEAGSAFNLAVVTPDGSDPVNASWKVDGTSVNAASVTLTAGSHLIEATVTLSDSKTYKIKLEVTAE